MGSSISDRTNRVTIIKLVAQKLGIDREGSAEFYLLDNDVVLRKGYGEYDPEAQIEGFYMGSSVVDRDNRITIIKLVVQNLKIEEGDFIEFYLHNDNVVIRKALERLREYDPKETSKECHNLVSRLCVNYISEVDEFIRKNGIEAFSEEKEKEIFERLKEKEDMAALSEDDIKRLPLEFEYVLNELSNSEKKWKEYYKKYSSKYQERSELLKYVQSGNELPNGHEDDVVDENIPSPKIIVPKRTKMRQLFALKK
jgi:hypothetical protein